MFFTSPFEKATIVSLDGVGEWETAWYGEGDGNHKKNKLCSLAKFSRVFCSMTQFLGYKENSDEYKVMGMAPYGKPKYYSTIAKMININKSKLSISLDQTFFDFPYGKHPYYNLKKFKKIFGNPSSYQYDPSPRDKNIASSFQKYYQKD